MVFQRFFEEHVRKAYRTALILSRDHFLAEDIVQESFYRAYKFRNRLRIGEPFGPWFAKILLNVARSQLGKRVAPPTAFRPESLQALDIDLKVNLAQALQQLERLHVEVIVLRYYLDYSEAQMAEVLGVPKGTVKSRLSHARRRLSEHLERAGEEEEIGAYRTLTN